MRPPLPAPMTVSPAVATKQSILQRARAVADSHGAADDKPAKKVSGDWKDFFSETKTVYVASRGCTFNVYIAGDHGPVLFCLHGAGYTGLTFALIAEELSKECESTRSRHPSMLSIYAILHLSDTMLHCRHRVVAMDQRHHGLTTTDVDPGDNLNFSKETFSEDAAALWEEMFGEEKPPTVLVGHSFGGAIAVWTAKELPFPSLEGLVVIDVVEGTAIGVAPPNHPPRHRKISHHPPAIHPQSHAALLNSPSNLSQPDSKRMRGRSDGSDAVPAAGALVRTGSGGAVHIWASPCCAVQRRFRA